MGDGDELLHVGGQYAADPAEIRVLRGHLRGFFASAGIDGPAADELLVAATEAATNAMEHAVDPARPVIDVSAQFDGRVVSIVVRDYGRWREPRPTPDRGRGSTIMRAAGDVRVAPTPDGTTVTITRRIGS